MKKTRLLITTALIGAMLMTGCSDDGHSRRKNRDKDRDHGDTTTITSSATREDDELYTLDDIQTITEADFIDDARLVNEDALYIMSTNVYDGAHVVIFDTASEASDFYSDYVNNYIAEFDYTGDNYVVGTRCRVTDVEIHGMALCQQNVVLTIDTEVSSTVLLDQHDVEAIASQWNKKL